MRQGFDWSVIAGIGLLAAMMVGIAVTADANTRKLREVAARATQSHEFLDVINTIRIDTRKLQAMQRSYLINGFEEWIPPYREAATALRADAEQLLSLTAGDAEQYRRAQDAAKQIESGIMSLDEVVKLRGKPNGHAAVVAIAKERGQRSFVDPLLDTLTEMDHAERERLAAREEEARSAYDGALFSGIAAALLGLVALGLIAWMLERNSRAKARYTSRLDEQRQLLDATLSSIGDAVITTDIEGKVTFLNAVAEGLTGWPLAEAVGTPLDKVFRIINETTRRPVNNPARRALEEGAIVGLANHTILISRAGFEHPIDDSAAPILSRGKVSGAVLVFRDITERKEAEASLAKSEERYRVLVTANSDVVYRMSSDWSEMLPLDGHDRAASGPEPIRDWMERNLPREEHERVREQIKQAIARKQTFEMEHQVLRADGSVAWTHSRAAPILDDTGKIVEWFGTARDVTDRRNMEAALREADRKKDDFIALLAHELRNPLAPIRNGLKVIRLTDDKLVLKKSLAMMDRQLSHMVRMIDDLLDVSRIGRNKMELRRARISVADVMASAVETARPAIEEAGLELTVTPPPQPIFLEGDLTRLSQVFSNLLTNSAKYTPRGGKVWFFCEHKNGKAIISVKDTGSGIPPESLPTIFNMFSQIDRSIEKSSGGLGLGLALVKGLAEMHGGSVTAQSDGQGQGSTFTVTLPEQGAGPEFAPLQSDPMQPALPFKRRILVVDDNRDGADSLMTMLRILGNEVMMANDGIEAIERAELFRPGLILMDIGMPRLNGLDATKRIRQTTWGKNMTIIALTGWGQENDRQRSREAGCDGHLVKPLQLAELEKMLVDLGK